jgi:hypothetical protein
MPGLSSAPAWALSPVRPWLWTPLGGPYPEREAAHGARCLAPAGVHDGVSALLVQRIADHIQRYRESFRWEKRGTETVEDRAALISAAGWCSGWRSLLALAAGAQL